MYMGVLHNLDGTDTMTFPIYLCMWFITSPNYFFSAIFQFFMLILLSEVNIFSQRISKKIILAQNELGVRRIVLTHFYALVAPEAFKSENCNCDG